MKTKPARLLLASLVSASLALGTLAVPASAGSGQWRGDGWSGASYYQPIHYKKKGKKYRRYYGKSYKHYGKRYYYKKRHKRHRHSDRDFFIGLGLGMLGAAIITAPRYRSTGNWCHVHRYSVRGMSFHRDVRCFKHRNWDHPSIVYVR